MSWTLFMQIVMLMFLAGVFGIAMIQERNKRP